MNILSIILSSTIISTIISSAYLSFTNRRREYIENITKDRKEWREKLKSIVESMIDVDDLNTFQDIINMLKININPYGRVTFLVFDDSYLWEFFATIPSDKSDIDVKKEKLIDLLACMLKYDWERSKDEIRGNSQLRLLIINSIINFLFYSFYYIIHNKLLTDNLSKSIEVYLECYLFYCTLITSLTIVYVMVISYADKWKKHRDLFILFIMSGIATILYIIFYSFNVNSIVDLECLEMLLLIQPIIGFLYTFIVKVIRYRNNVGRLITSISLTYDKKIPSRYRLFVPLKIYQNQPVKGKYPKEKAFFYS